MILFESVMRCLRGPARSATEEKGRQTRLTEDEREERRKRTKMSRLNSLVRLEQVPHTLQRLFPNLPIRVSNRLRLRTRDEPIKVDPREEVVERVVLWRSALRGFATAIRCSASSSATTAGSGRRGRCDGVGAEAGRGRSGFGGNLLELGVDGSEELGGEVGEERSDFCVIL